MRFISIFMLSAATLAAAVPISGPVSAQEPKVRLWVPFARDSLPRNCLAADLEDWMAAVTEDTGEMPVPHTFTNLPDGKFEDQVRAALETGEQPDLLLADVSTFPDNPRLGRGQFYGADLIGLWVHQRKIAQLPQASVGFTGLWLGDADTALAAADDFLLLLREAGETPLGIDGGPRGADLGYSMALMIEQWTRAFVEPELPPIPAEANVEGEEGQEPELVRVKLFGDNANWDDGGLEDMFSVLGRWQQEGLMVETQFATQFERGEALPILNIARYSQGRDLGPEWAFYPLFSSVEGKAATFLELPMQWYSLRPEETVFSEALTSAISRSQVFETCAETAGLISRAQIDNLLDVPVLDLFADRQGQILPSDLRVDITEWTGRQPDLPMNLSNTLRDMRAGLDTAVALRTLRAIYEDE